MKKITLIIGMLLLIFNTFSGLIIPVYQPYNFLMVDLSIILTTAIIGWLAGSKYSNATKIGLTVLLSITGFVRMICMIIMPATMENNILLLIAMGILILELICMAGALFVDKK